MKKQYIQFIQELKQNIINSRYTAARLVNKEQLVLYYHIGKSLSEKIIKEKWGTKVIEQIAADLQQQLPGLKGFSFSNLKNMRQFYDTYKRLSIGQALPAQLGVPAISQTLSGQLQQDGIPEYFWGISFSHHVSILHKCSNLEEQLFYINQSASQSWSLRVMEHHIESALFKQQGQLANNFTQALPEKLKANALDVFRDEYLFDFVQMDEGDNERVFEGQVVANIKNTIMTLGKGFCFIGNQYRLELEEEEFYIDLLFYNRYLQCLVAFELKSGKFKPEYAGQLNFYLNVLDEKIKLPEENPSIGIILCKEKSNTVVEFAFKNISKGMGAATFKTSKQVPKEMKGILPEAKDLAQLL